MYHEEHFYSLIFTILIAQFPSIYAQWTEHYINDNIDGAAGLELADMDGDNDLDVVASGWNADCVFWYENPSWTKHFIDSVSTGTQSVRIADMNGDNNLDVIAIARDANDVRWYESPTWNKHVIDTNLEGGRGLYIVDIDGDTDMDVVATGMFADDVVWYEAPTWTKHIIDDNLDGAIDVYVIDFDDDSDLDILVAGYDAHQVVWYESPSLTKTIIDSDLNGARRLDVADMDDDGDLDIVATAMGADNLVWYESPLWTKHIVDSEFDGAYFLFAADIDFDNDPDIIANGHYADKVIYYENLYNMAYGLSINVSPSYMPPQGDTLKVTAEVVNLHNHQISVFAMIEAKNSTFQDSIQLYDDGSHGDENPNDNVWGGLKWYTGLIEDMYITNLSTRDSTEGTTHYLAVPTCFTTIGPVVFESYTVTGDTLIDLGDKKKFQFTLYNSGNSATANNVSSQVVCLDTFASISALVTSEYGDIAPGTSANGNPKQYINFSNNCAGGQNICFALDIFSNGQKFWSDTFSVIISNLEEIKQTIPLSFQLKQNYPNPFNPTTNIQFSISNSQFVSLKIYNLLGQEVTTLVSEKLKAGKYQYIWDAGFLASGVYLYHMQAGEYVETKKMILLR